MGIYEWSTPGLSLGPKGGPHPAYYVCKMSRYRKQAMVMKDDGHTLKSIAYFRSEEEAKEFAKLFGGAS